MLYYEGLSCPVCKKPFQESDDMVVCPVCGLPHHRACWMIDKHCHDEVFHGTEQQWSRENATEPDDPIDEEDSIAEDVAQPRPQTYEYTPAFIPSSVSPEETDIEFLEDIPLTDYSAIVQSNQRYYLPRFLSIAKHKQLGGWNWAAFIFGWRWLLYRKQYGLGIALFAARAFMLISLLAMMSFLGADVLMDYATSEEMVSAANQLSNSLLEDPILGPFAMLWSVFSWFYLSSRLFLGFFGNHLYYKNCRSKIQKVKAKIPDISAGELVTYGGTAMGIALIFHLILEFLPMILSTFLLTY